MSRSILNLNMNIPTSKKTIEVQTIAIGALVNKSALERLNQKYDKIFDALLAHDNLTNERLGDIQGQIIELDGKIVGLQTETRQYFYEADNKAATLDGKIVGLQTEMHQRFMEQTALLTQILERLP